MKNVIISVIGILAFLMWQQGSAKSANSYTSTKASAAALLAYNQYKSNSGARTFIFDPRRLHWYAYEGGRLVASGRASGGSGYCRDIKRSCRTPVGVFRVLSKGSSNCRSTRYPKPHGGARMDYCMFFTNMYAVHGSSDVPNYNASHGCVRVLPSDARWLNSSFMQIGTRVIVRSY